MQAIRHSYRVVISRRRVGNPVGEGDGGDGAGGGAQEDPERDAVDDAAGHDGCGQRAVSLARGVR